MSTLGHPGVAACPAEPPGATYVRTVFTNVSAVLGAAVAVINALPSRYRAVGVVAAGCGLRQGEAFGLRVCDVYFLRHRVRVEQQILIVRSKLTVGPPKGGKTRTVPLAEPVALELAEHLRRYPERAMASSSRAARPSR